MSKTTTDKAIAVLEELTHMSQPPEIRIEAAKAILSYMQGPKK